MTTTTRFGMARAWVLPLAVGIVIGAMDAGVVPAQQQAIKATRLLQVDLTGVEGKEVIMTIIEAQPGVTL